MELRKPKGLGNQQLKQLLDELQRQARKLKGRCLCNPATPSEANAKAMSLYWALIISSLPATPGEMSLFNWVLQPLSKKWKKHHFRVRFHFVWLDH